MYEILVVFSIYKTEIKVVLKRGSSFKQPHCNCSTRFVFFINVYMFIQYHLSLCRLITQKLWKVRFHAIDLWRLMSKRWSLLTKGGSTYYLLPNHMKPSLSRLDLYFKLAKVSGVKYTLAHVCAHGTVPFPSLSNFFHFMKSFWRNLPKN